MNNKNVHVKNINGEQGGFTVDASNPFIRASEGLKFPAMAARVVEDATVGTLVRSGRWKGATTAYDGKALAQGYEIPGPIESLSVTAGSIDIVFS